MQTLGTASSMNQYQQILAMKTMLDAEKYMGDTRNVISQYADSPMLAYQKDNWQQSMQNITNPIDRQLGYKLKDIAFQKGNEFHSFGRRAMQAGAMSDANNQIANISTNRLMQERQAQSQDWQNALAMQNQATKMDIGSLLGTISASTNQSVINPGGQTGQLISNIGSMVGGMGSKLGNLVGSAQTS